MYRKGSGSFRWSQQQQQSRSSTSHNTSDRHPSAKHRAVINSCQNLTVHEIHPDQHQHLSLAATASETVVADVDYVDGD